ncbi:hypothetical protein [Candidatus Enterococcus clewellii]|uniref:Uncharacterized protein n=1 Tax=Candidatus Enterococcus clewellii TaxID=1834193 RepID=A0A242K9C1_9ENTE|nr:hypothetical protein [Enterococcus sp. 9E7_DIV0242]OTP17556.1 hypothetical protein A5888_001694 [Enterococcus sp. 9E7_DIV0242]
MIELVTASGLRRSVQFERIVDICELPKEKRSSVVISLSTGEVIFVADSYDEVMDKYRNEKKEPVPSANDTSQ